MRGRPRLDVGTFGNIRTNPQPDGTFKAIAQFRDYDGKTRQYSRKGPSKTRAEANLKRFFAEKTKAASMGEVSAATRLSFFAEEYLGEIETHVKEGTKSPNTIRLYRHAWEKHIQPAMGELTVREVTTRRCDLLLKSLRERNGPDYVKTVRSTLSGIMSLVVRYDALQQNPVREASPISGAHRKVRALLPEEAVDLWEKLTLLSQTATEAINGRYRQTYVDPDIPDLVLWMLGTGQRIGQALALHWPWIDLDEATASVGPNVIRVKGEGLRLNSGTSKSKDSELDLPAPVVAMLETRTSLEDYLPMGPVFPSDFGGLRDPSNTSADLREALDLAGYEWVTSHVFRKTVATVLDDAGLSARHVADQLNHSRPSMTQDKYMARRARNPRAREALEAMMATSGEKKVLRLER